MLCWTVIINSTVKITQLQGGDKQHRNKSNSMRRQNVLDGLTQQIHHLTQLGSYLGNGDGSNSLRLTASNVQMLHLVWYSCDHMA